MRTSAHVDRPLGLFTDLYELRMAATCLLHGRTAPATFSLYIRPDAARPWILSAGTSAVLDLLDDFSYAPDEIDYLASDAVGLHDEALDWLSDLELTGELRAVADGTIVLGEEPLLEFTGPLPEVMLLETAIMAVAGFPTLIATKAARCAIVSGDAKLADFGARRAHGLQAGLEAARAAYIGGVGATSNVEAGRRYGIPVVGTMAHSFIQAYEDEQAAFTDFADDHPGNAIMLVDTYDTLEGVELAKSVADDLGIDIAGVRLDSGDLVALSKQAAERLDDEGVFVSSGMDEYRIERFLEAGGVATGFGPGTALATSADAPKLELVYKLVAVERDGQLEPTMKLSTGKETYPGAKSVRRVEGPDGYEHDVLDVRGETAGDDLLVDVYRDGERVYETPDLSAIRDRVQREVRRLPPAVRAIRDPTIYPVEIGEALERTVEDCRRALAA